MLPVLISWRAVRHLVIGKGQGTTGREEWTMRREEGKKRYKINACA